MKKVTTTTNGEWYRFYLNNEIYGVLIYDDDRGTWVLITKDSNKKYYFESREKSKKAVIEELEG